MEKVYRKLPSGRYEEIGYNAPDMADGLYFRQTVPYGKRTTSIAYWHGTDPQEPVDIKLLTQIMSMDDEIGTYISRIQDPNSDEFQKLKDDSGGYLTEPPLIYNISPNGLAVAILRRVYGLLRNQSH